MAADEDPKLFFARVDGIINTLRSAGITKEEREITRIIIRNLPDNYDVERSRGLGDVYKRQSTTLLREFCNPTVFPRKGRQRSRLARNTKPSRYRVRSVHYGGEPNFHGHSH